MSTFNLADLFELVAAKVPDRVALVVGDSRETFGELDARSNQLARYLAAQGVGVGTKVAILAWNRAEWVEAMYAAYKLRAIPVNINYRYVADELRYVLDNADAEVVVLERCFVPTLASIRAELPSFRHAIVIEDGSSEAIGALGALGDSVAMYEDAVGPQSGAPLGIERSSDDLYMLYTGGTTGMPKGVVWRHEDLFFAAFMGLGFGGQTAVASPEEVVSRIAPPEWASSSMTVAPIMHGAAQWGLMITLLGGGKIVLNPDRGFEPHAVWRLIEKERCTIVMVVGDAIARPLVEALEDPSVTYDVSCVKVFGSGGALFSQTVKDQLRAKIPGLITNDSIGSSEMGAAGGSMNPAGGQRFSIHSTVSVLDDELRPLSPGDGRTGMLARRGHLPLGYYKDDTKTAATFVTDPDGVRWAVPGDFATIEADGTVLLLGRGSACINTGGEKVYPDEVEMVLKSHPEVFDVLVVGVPDERFGSRVAAVVQARPGCTPTLDELAAHCRQHIAGYKVPRVLRLVESIGRTASGKADYAWARSQF